MFHAVLCLLRNDILFETNSNIATCNVISVLPDVSDKGTFLVLSEREREEKQNINNNVDLQKMCAVSSVHKTHGNWCAL